ncbi:MAG: hypothetical protein BECKG1743D_GA0114223_112633, partial [Candidatus Kentron sp. G]
RATMSAIRHPCLIVGRCPSNFEGRNSLANKDTKFVLTAEDFHGLARGLVTLAKRSELRLDPMRIRWLDGKPAAILDDFCILLRDPPRG